MPEESYWLGLLGGLTVLALSVELVRRRHVRGRLAIGWFAAGAVAVLLAVFPSALWGLADLLRVRVPLNLVLFAGVLFLLTITMQLASEVGRLDARTRRLAEEIALLSASPASPDRDAAAGPGRGSTTPADPTGPSPSQSDAG